MKEKNAQVTYHLIENDWFQGDNAGFKWSNVGLKEKKYTSKNLPGFIDTS